MNNKFKKMATNEIGPWITIAGCALTPVYGSPIPAFISILLSIVVEGMIINPKVER